MLRKAACLSWDVTKHWQCSDSEAMEVTVTLIQVNLASNIKKMTYV